MINLISQSAKKRPGQAWRPYPNAMLSKLLAAYTRRAALGLSEERSFENRKPSNSSGLG